MMFSLLAAFSMATCSNQEGLDKIRDSASAKNPGTSDEGAGRTEEADMEKPTERESILITYFSRFGNTENPDDVDASTSASIVVDGDKRYGTTEYVAEMIRQNVGGELYRIETVTPYTTDFDELRDVNHAEIQQGLSKWNQRAVCRKGTSGFCKA